MSDSSVQHKLHQQSPPDVNVWSEKLQNKAAFHLILPNQTGIIFTCDSTVKQLVGFPDVGVSCG